MDKKQILNTLNLLKGFSKKRNFIQSVDLVINLKNLNLKKPEENVDLFLTLPHSFGRKLKICAFADKSLKDITKIFDKVISQDEFIVYKDTKKLKKLANSYDYFIAQADLMGKVATTFGKVLGPKNKMPNPKAGCVFPPNADLKSIKDKLEGIIRLKTKNEPIVKASVGKEDMKEEELVENIFYIYNSLIHALPNEDNNIKDIYLKYTMGTPIKIGEQKEDIEKKLLEKAPAKEKKLLEKAPVKKEKLAEKASIKKDSKEKEVKKLKKTVKVEGEK